MSEIFGGTGLNNKLDGGNKWGNTEKEGKGKKQRTGISVDPKTGEKSEYAGKTYR